MKLFAALSFLFLCFFTNSYSQQRRFIAGVNTGLSLPSGKYASKMLNDYRAGWAQLGISLNVSATYQLSKTFGITMVAGGQENKQSKTTLKESITQGAVEADVKKITTKSWQTANLMGGGIFRIPIADSDRITLFAGATAGISKTHAPGSYFLVVFYNSDMIPASTVESNNSGRNLKWTFCYSIRSGLSFRLSKGLYLLGILSYFDARPEETYYFANPGGYINTQQIKHSLSTFTAEAGLGIQL